MCVSAPFGDYDHNIVGELELQQPIQWRAAKCATIPRREVSNMLYQRDKTGTCGKEFPDSSKRTGSEMKRDSPVFRSGSPLCGNKCHVILQICLQSIILVAHLLLAHVLDDVVPIDDPVHIQRTCF